MLHNPLSVWAISQSQERGNRTLDSIRALLGKKGSVSNLHFWAPQPRMSSPWKNNNKIRWNKRQNNSREAGDRTAQKAAGLCFFFPCSSFVLVIDSKQKKCYALSINFSVVTKVIWEVFFVCVHCYEVAGWLLVCCMWALRCSVFNSHLWFASVVDFCWQESQEPNSGH